MKKEISYADAKTRYPEHVADIMAQLRASTSKERERDESELRYFVSWCQGSQSITPAQFLAEKHQPEPNTWESYLEDMKSRVLVCLKGSIKRACKYSKPITPEVPEEIIQCWRKGWERQQADRERVSKMTDDERNAEITDLVGQLQGMGGFAAFTFKKQQN